MRKVLSYGLLLLLAGCSGRKSEPAASIVPPSEPIPAAYFGMHIHRPGLSTPWPSVLIGTLRLHDCEGVFWNRINPEKDQWDFRRLDTVVAMAQVRGVKIIYTLGQTPRWAASDLTKFSIYGSRGSCTMPRDIQDWKTYVRTVARRYHGRITAYEVWNEPNVPGFWTGTPVQMASLAREARSALDEVDPKILLVSPAVDLVKPDAFLPAGIGEYCDVLSTHLYMNPADLPEDAVAYVDVFKRIVAAFGLAKKPLWNTESYLGRVPQVVYDDDEGGAILARSYIIFWALGLRRYCWYSWDNWEYSGVRMTERDAKTLTRAAKAFGALQSWLVGSTMLRLEHKLDEPWVASLRMADGSPRWIVWTSAKSSMTYTLPKEWRAKRVTKLVGFSEPIIDGKLSVANWPLLIEP